MEPSYKYYYSDWTSDPKAFDINSFQNDVDEFINELMNLEQNIKKAEKIVSNNTNKRKNEQRALKALRNKPLPTLDIITQNIRNTLKNKKNNKKFF